MKVEDKTKVVLENTEEYIRKLPYIYDQITFNQIRQKTGIKLKEVRDMVENMIFNKQIAAKISGNTVIFLKTELYDETTGKFVSPSYTPPSSSGSQVSTIPYAGSIGTYTENLWIIVIIGCFLNIVSIFAPAAHILFGTLYYWLWGLIVSPVSIEIFLDLTGVYGIISSICIGVLDIFIIYSANKVRIGDSMIEEETDRWIILSIIMIILIILWIILIENYHFFSWTLIVPGHTIIGIFLGNGLILISGIIGR